MVNECLSKGLARLCLVAGLACGPALGAAPPAPLTPTDISYYLTVTRAAAERIRHPTRADLAARRRAGEATERQLAAYKAFAVRFQGGNSPTAADIDALRATDPDPADAAAQRLTQSLKLQPGAVVAAERHLDLARYLRIRQTVERIVVMVGDADDRDGDGDREHDRERVATADRESGGETRVDAASLHGVDARNAAQLRPYLPEIRRLLAVTLQGAALDTD